MASIVGTTVRPRTAEDGAAVGAGPPPAISEIADPAPLGLAAFGITTLCLSAINANWITAAAVPMVLALALPFGGIGQIIAGLWAFRRGNTFAATAFCAFGAFWLSYYLLATNGIPAITAAGGAAAVQTSVGMFLLAWGIFTTYMLVASLGGSRAVTVVFLLLAATFFALSYGDWTPNADIKHLGGYLGLLTAVAALYTSFADVTNANFKRRILPT